MISLPFASLKGAAVCFLFGLVPFPSALHLKPNVIIEGDKLGAEHKAKTHQSASLEEEGGRGGGYGQCFTVTKTGSYRRP